MAPTKKKAPAKKRTTKAKTKALTTKKAPLPASNVKRVLKESEYLKIAAMAGRGFRHADIYHRLGISSKTWQRLRDEDPRAAEAFEIGRSELEERLRSKLINNALKQNNTACLIFALKSMFGYRDQGPDPVQHTTNVQIVLPAALPREQYIKELDAVAQRRLLAARIVNDDAR